MRAKSVSIEESVPNESMESFKKTKAVLSDYERATWSFSRLVSAIGRSEKRLRKLERGKRVFGQVVFDQCSIKAEGTKLIALWSDVETIAGVCTGTLGPEYLEDIASVAVKPLF